MIKGVTRELYEGTTEAPGIGRYLTVYGDGKINVNTAPMPVLKALFKYPDAVSADALEQMDIHRTTQKEDLSGVAWFKEKIPGRAGVDVNTALIKTGSDDFEISATVRLNNVVSRVSGAVNRQDRKKIKLLSWELE
jgi:general secretion pathway protein K